MKICIPHYTKLVERRAALSSELARQGLEACWIEEFDQEDLTDEQIAGFVDQSSLRERAAVTERASGSRHLYPEKPLRRSEVSIALKQVEILRHHAMAPEGYVIVLEDDVVFRTKDFAGDFARGLAKTPYDWDLIFFGGSGIPAERRPFFRAMNRAVGKTVFRRSTTRCLDSYAIKSAAADRLAAAIGTIALPIDWELNYWIAKLELVVYWWEPGLTEQGSQTGVFASSIRKAP